MPRLEIDLPKGYRLSVEGLHLDVIKPGSELQPLRPGEREGGLPARVQVITGIGPERKQIELFESDFVAEEPVLSEDGVSITGRFRGLALTQAVRWAEIEVRGRRRLILTRQVHLTIESIEFADPDHVRIQALTRWGGLGQETSYELAAHMGWHHWKDKKWHYHAWVSPCMYDADGPVAAGEGEYFDPANVHTMGLAEYTTLSWPSENRAVMVAIDPVEYLEREFNPDVEQRGPAQAAYLGWFQPQDVGAIHSTAVQHYIFLDDELDPLLTSADVWRECFARGINDYLQPIEELQPWFATEKLLGAHLPDAYVEAWDGNITSLEERYSALRKDPLDSRVHPILTHERPGMHILFSARNQYFNQASTPAGRAVLIVPLYHLTGDRFTSTCEVRSPEQGCDIGFELSVSGKGFAFQGAVVTWFKQTHPYTGPAGEVPPEKVQVEDTDGGIRVRVEHSAAAVARDFPSPEEYAPMFEIHLRVTKDIGPNEGLVEAYFLHRETGEDDWQRVNIIDGSSVRRGDFIFPADHFPVQARTGSRTTENDIVLEGYYYEVKDGKPIRLDGREVVRRLGQLMRRYDVALSAYVSGFCTANYDNIRNSSRLMPNVAALDEDRNTWRIWYKGGNRSDGRCSACEPHNRTLADCLRQLLSLGPFGIYYDELAGGPASCFGREHGHALDQNQRFSHKRGEMMRKVAREAGYPEMYIGSEAGNFLQHTFAQGHNFDGINPSLKDNNFEELKRLMIGQASYDFPSSRAYFNYVLSSQFSLDGDLDRIFGNVLGLAFPRFALAPFTGFRNQVSYYFTAGVKRAFPGHYLKGHTEFPAESLRSDAPPMTTAELVLRSDEGVSVHLANLSGSEVMSEKEGYAARLADGCAVLADSFGNVMGEISLLSWQGRDYLRLDRPAAIGLWRTEKAEVFLQALEIDRRPLESPLTMTLSNELLHRLGVSGVDASLWRGLDRESKSLPVTVSALPDGLQIVYPDDPAYRCVYKGCRPNVQT